MPEGDAVLEQIRRMQQEMESLGDAMNGKLGALRNEMREGFARQERGQAELARVAAELGRDVARQGASFDQTIAGMLEDFGRSRRNQSTIWSALIERTAEMQNDVGDLRRDTGDLRRRVDDVERRMAG